MANFSVPLHEREEVPRRWLERYGHLVEDVTFYFLSNEGELEWLAGPKATSQA